MQLRPGVLGLIIVAIGGAISSAGAGSKFADLGQAELERPFTPAISMDKDRRETPAEFARQAGIVLQDEVGATGLVRCGAATGTGQLTVRNDVITTAAHVLIDENGKRRVGCVFEPMIGTGPIPIDYTSIKTGSDMPLSQRATRDWAVAKLVAPAPVARPYAVAPSLALPSTILMCAGGNKEFAAMGMEQCSARKVIGKSPEGIREIAIDCNAGPGSSGAALLSSKKVLGIYVGYRSAHPKRAQAFSDTHYNFAITVDGPFKRALLAAGGQ